MKKRIYLALVVIGMVVFMGACRGLKNAPPCPAYSMNEIQQTSSQLN
ncbi:MAG: hypothetical protein U0W24_18655 [Bacteroidales bacterium]